MLCALSHVVTVFNSSKHDHLSSLISEVWRIGCQSVATNTPTSVDTCDGVGVHPHGVRQRGSLSKDSRHTLVEVWVWHSVSLVIEAVIFPCVHTCDGHNVGRHEYHCFLVVGFGTESGTDFLEVKDSVTNVTPGSAAKGSCRWFLMSFNWLTLLCTGT